MEGKELLSLIGDEQIFFFAYIRKRKAIDVLLVINGEDSIPPLQRP